MTYMPGSGRHGRGQNRTFLDGVTMLMVLFSVFILVKVRTAWSIVIACSLFLIAFMIQKSVQATNNRMTVQVSVLGVIWFHPQKGGGTMPWGNIGALSVREKITGGPMDLVLTPRDMENGSSMMAHSSDLASGIAEGRNKMTALVGEVMRNMPSDTILDRSTKAWAERMGLSRGKG